MESHFAKRMPLHSEEARTAHIQFLFYNLLQYQMDPDLSRGKRRPHRNCEDLHKIYEVGAIQSATTPEAGPFR